MQVDAGREVLDDPQPLPAASRAGGSGILNRLHSPVLSLRDHALLMILLSDNTSTNVLIDRLGAEAITARMQALGASGYKLRRRMLDTAAAARGDENVASASDLVVVMDAIRTGRGLQPASQAEAIRILREYGPTSVRAGVPSGVPVATKPGGLDGVQSEVSWVDLKGRPYLFCVMTSFLADDRAAGTSITEMSKAAYQYFSRLARAGDRRAVSWADQAEHEGRHRPTRLRSRSLDVQPDRRRAEARDFAHIAAHLHEGAPRRRATLLRQHRDLGRTIVDLVEPVRYQRKAPGRGDAAGDLHLAVVVVTRVVADVGDRLGAHGAAGEAQREQDRENRSGVAGHECLLSLRRSWNPGTKRGNAAVDTPPAHPRQPSPGVLQRLHTSRPHNAECGDASACLYGFRIPLTRRSPAAPLFKGRATWARQEVAPQRPGCAGPALPVVLKRRRARGH